MRRALVLLVYLWIRDAHLRDKKQNVKQYCVDQLTAKRGCLMSEEQMMGVIGIAGVYRSNGTMFTEEALRGLAEKDDRFEYEEETGNLFFSTTWSEADLRGLSWSFAGEAI